MSVIIRRALVEDAKAVAELSMKLVIQHQEYDPNRFTRIADFEGMEWFYGGQTKAKDAAVIVAELDSKIVGFAFVQYEPKNYANLLESAAWLHDIYVNESVRGHNVGKSLIEASGTAAEELGADKLMLTVAVKNQFARDFFEKAGFRSTMVEMMLGLD